MHASREDHLLAVMAPRLHTCCSHNTDSTAWTLMKVAHTSAILQIQDGPFLSVTMMIATGCRACFEASNAVHTTNCPDCAVAPSWEGEHATGYHPKRSCANTSTFLSHDNLCAQQLSS
mmetsp:Transcript_52390/g.121816  ORF Transcript_52390/g.121816 Transcript_52390/m.121816 type:complete len:118 (+) Transcript_52390:33-386(+)